MVCKLHLNKVIFKKQPLEKFSFGLVVRMLSFIAGGTCLIPVAKKKKQPLWAVVGCHGLMGRFSSLFQIDSRPIGPME